MTEPSTPPETHEPTISPHFTFPDSDLTIRSSDKVEFRVHKSILSFASGVFKDMLSLDSLPSTSSSTSPQKIVDVTEDGESIEAVLRYIYPLPHPIFKTIDQIVMMLDLSDKYNVPVINAAMQECLLANSFFKKSLLRTFAIAKKYQLSKVETTVIPEILKDPASFSFIDYPPEEVPFIAMNDIQKINFYTRSRYAKAKGILRRAEEKIGDRPAPMCPCRSGDEDTASESESDSESSSDDTPAHCEVWFDFYEAAKKRLEFSPSFNITDKSFWDAIVADCSCRNAGINLFEHYAPFIKRANEKIRSLPWIFPDDFEDMKQRAQKKNVRQRKRARFEYEPAGEGVHV